MYKIHLGCLPASSTRDQLLSYFSQFGRFRDAKITRKSKSLCSGDGWLICDDKNTYDRILKIKNFEFGGRTIFCEPMLTGEQLQEKNKSLSLRRIFVSNLPATLQDHQIFELFSVFGDVQNAYRIVSLKNEKRPFGFVTFLEQSSAVHAVQTGKIYFDQRPIYISDFKKHKPETRSCVILPHSDEPNNEICPPRAWNTLDDLGLQESTILEYDQFDVHFNLLSAGFSKNPTRGNKNQAICSVSKLCHSQAQLGSVTSLNPTKGERSAAKLSTVGSLQTVNRLKKGGAELQQHLKPTSKSYYQQRGSDFLSEKERHRETELVFQLSPPKINLQTRIRTTPTRAGQTMPITALLAPHDSLLESSDCNLQSQQDAIIMASTGAFSKKRALTSTKH